MSQLCSGLDPYQQIVEKTLTRNIPFKVDWEITYGCNLRCRHCYQTGPQDAPELSTNTVFSILDKLAHAGCLYLTFTGGEIFTRPDFFAIAQYARKKEFALRLFTNGTLIDEAVADRIKGLQPLSVEISLYGTSRHVHEAVTRVKGSFQATVKALALLKERSIHTILKCTFMQPNAGEFTKMNEFAKKIGLPFSFSFSIIPKVDGTKDILAYRLKEQELQEIFKANFWLVEGIEKGGVESYDPLCSAGINSLYISPYGEVYPCVVLRKECGNITDTPLDAIWQAPFFKTLRAVGFNDLSECKRCEAAGYCDRCGGLALMEGGDLCGPSRNDCTLAQVRKQALKTKGGFSEKHKEKEAVQKA